MSKSRLLIEEHGTRYSTKVEVDTFGNPPGIPKDSYLQHKLMVPISWALDEEHRSWGIKSLRPVVPDQEVELVYLESTDDDDIEHIINWKIENADVKFSSEGELSSIQILPVTLEVDFNKKKSIVIFQIS